MARRERKDIGEERKKAEGREREIEEGSERESEQRRLRFRGMKGLRNGRTEDDILELMVKHARRMEGGRQRLEGKSTRSWKWSGGVGKRMMLVMAEGHAREMSEHREGEFGSEGVRPKELNARRKNRKWEHFERQHRMVRRERTGRVGEKGDVEKGHTAEDRVFSNLAEAKRKEEAKNMRGMGKGRNWRMEYSSRENEADEGAAVAE